MAGNQKKVSVQSRKKDVKKSRSKGFVIGVTIGGGIVLSLIVVLTMLWINNNKKETLPVFDHNPIVEIDIKDYGVITLELDGKQAPITVNNFIKLANEGFYDGLTFHRIINGFMMQGGDPQGTGMGGSDTEIKGEFISNGVNNTISHVRGTISMARSSGSKDSASSQFFIMHQNGTSLDGDYAAFGHVLSGMEIVDAICADSLQNVTDNNGTIPFASQPIINSIRIIE